MCGIAGIITTERFEDLHETLRTMGEVLHHRGPDDEGYYLHENVGFVHKRLSIIDLLTGHQPMCNEDESVWIVLNGEIYNYLELRTQLLAQGHVFRTSSDTEVILHLYEQHGDQFLNKLIGMFAFVIHDQRKNRLLAARDYFGIKPLYYAFDDKGFIFASEIKSIVKVRPQCHRADVCAINEYLTFQFCLGDKTFFQGVRKLLPGHYLVVEDVPGRPRMAARQYWNLDFTVDPTHDEDHYADRVLMLLEDSVRLQLRSDVPLGCHLSGGLDSTSVTCIAASLLDAQVKTFTGAFSEGKDYDETEYAREVSLAAGTEYFEVRPTAADFVDTLPRIIYHMDEPAAGPGVFPQFLVSKLASEHVKVVLGGQGGDEMFGGYARYLVAYLEQCIKGAVYQTQEEGKYVVTLQSIIPNLAVLREYVPMMQSFWQTGLFEDMDRRYFRLIDRSDGIENLYSDDLLCHRRRHDVFAEFQQIFNAPHTKSYFNKMTHFDLKTLLPALLHVEDRTSMAFSLESRVPILDHRLAELVARIPPTMKFRGGRLKHIFKTAVRNVVPPKILNRQDKKGFPVPLTEWYQRELHDFVTDVLLSDSARQRGIYKPKRIEKALQREQKFGRQIWGLLCLELWFREFVD